MQHHPAQGLLALLALLALVALVAGCASAPLPRIQTAKAVDLDRFMGDWYVIAAIPAFIERKASNAIEHYDRAPDGTIRTTYTFRNGAADGPRKAYHPTGYVVDAVDHSTWAMQFLWPFRSEYLIAAVDPGYQSTIIARNARDYVWIMARTPALPDAEYRRLVAEVAALGYDTTRLRKVPQSW
jgi:apolipoprotein D and lipocalin family protein